MTLPLNLRKRLMLLMVATLLPLFALSIFKAVFNANAAVERALDDLRFAASLAAASQQRATETVQQVLTAIMKTPDIQAGQPARRARHPAELRQAPPLHTNLGIRDMTGPPTRHALANDKRA